MSQGISTTAKVVLDAEAAAHVQPRAPRAARVCVESEFGRAALTRQGTEATEPNLQCQVTLLQLAVHLSTHTRAELVSQPMF